MFLPTKQFTITWTSHDKQESATAKGFSELYRKLELVQSVLLKGGDISSLVITEVM